MKLPLSCLSLLITMLAAADTPEQFNLDSTGSEYPFVAHLKGRFTLPSDSVLIDVKEGSIISHIPTDLEGDGVAKDVGIAFGLGAPDSDGWAFRHETAVQVVGSSLQPGQSQHVPALHFVIPNLDTVPLSDRWLVAQILVQQHLPGIKAGPLASYACSEENLRGATPQSKERAKRMKDRYSQIC